MKPERLTAGQVNSLPMGTPVEVIWSGGNGPHTYYVTRPDPYNSCAVNLSTALELRMHRTAGVPFPARPAGTVGEHPLTQVWLKDLGLNLVPPGTDREVYVTEVITALLHLRPEERLAALEQFCVGCGTWSPYSPGCQCRNDE